MFDTVTEMLAIDAGKHEIESTYYVDGQVASQTQSEKTIDYHYDPAGRTEETETLVKGKPEATVIDHYAGPGEALTWASEGTEKWVSQHSRHRWRARRDPDECGHTGLAASRPRGQYRCDRERQRSRNKTRLHL